VTQVARDNHFVPQGYLRRWADAGDKVWCHRLLVSDARVPRWKRHSVRGIGFHEHLYTTILAGKESDQFERWIAEEFDTPGQEVIAKAVSEARLTREDWKALIRYVAAQDVRTPARYAESTKRWGTELQSLIQETLTKTISEWEAADDAGRERLKGERQRLSGPDKPDFPFKVSVKPDRVKGGGWISAETIVGRQLWLASIRWLLTKTVTVLYEHRWSIMRAPAGLSWTTSDDPVIRLNYNTEQDYNFGGGWGSRGSEFLFPLSPSHLLYTQIGHRHDSRINVTSEFAMKLHRIIAEHAHRWVYASAPLNHIDTLRSRKVGRQMYVEEMRAWRGWHGEQTAAELELQALPANESSSRVDMNEGGRTPTGMPSA